MLASTQLKEFPYKIFTYWVNDVEKRVFLLADAPTFYPGELHEHKVKLLEWGKEYITPLSALDFCTLVEFKKLKPFNPKYPQQ